MGFKSSDPDEVSNPRMLNAPATIGDLIELRISRRLFLGGAAATAVAGAAGCANSGPSRAPGASFTFAEIERAMDDTHHAPAGYAADVLLRWGDALFEDSPPFDPMHQTAAAQRRQFGVNNDFIGFIALDPAADGSARALLCVNHEYANAKMMFPGVEPDYPALLTKAHCEVEMAGHGSSIVEIVKRDGKWRPVIPSKFNRRITAETPMSLTGPAAGDDRLKTHEDPEGRTVLGTVFNCAGGITAWGSYLMAEENFHNYFGGELPDGHAEAPTLKRYSVGSSPRFVWGRYFDRFNLGKEQHEANRFGWIVEVDPFDPTSTPKKRTALGRFKHEGAESVIAPDGRVVLYSGDDERFEYVYKFVSDRKYVDGDRRANIDILESGTLHVARFDADGTLQWLRLVFGEGPLTAENGFRSQADVLIETRRAADLLGATPMDRPEDVEADHRTGRVYLMLTNNNRRKADQVNAANPRADNKFGHIIEIIEPDGDFASTTSRWDFLVKCGDPADPAVGATWNPATTKNGWFGSPDNCAIDPSGRLWIATDGNAETGAADGLWAMETTGPLRGAGRAFFRAPIGGEVTGPRFADDGTTLFLSVQHPGDDGTTFFERPLTRWPDFSHEMPARASVLQINKIDGGPIGS
ncbi:MAG: dTDP-glucose 4,6-dehydratase [Alphaproteobacteria bacterium RIFCSPHIGHO2_12_FULL_63_12]|nr:MAG: dTDP-glucose 4,6-dehydratase [Alphaproteobacteria bacterium RIFCSPHIGHO2_12_FULL_63_12]